MVESAANTIRRFINLLEGKKPAPRAELGVKISSQFMESLKRNSVIFPDLKEKLTKFIQVKKDDPLNGRYGKHDGPFSPGTPLSGYRHCHLRDDAILIYTMSGGSLNLYYICSHKEIEGKNTNKMSKALQGMTPQPASL